MSATMLPYGLYGLTDGNPYVQRALDPLKWPSDSDRLLGLNGFVQHEQVLTYLSRKVADKEPAFTDRRPQSHRTGQLLAALDATMLLLADAGFDAAAFLRDVSLTGAQFLIRSGARRCPTPVTRLPDGSYRARLGYGILPGLLPVRIIEATITITITTAVGTITTQQWRLITSLTDHARYPAAELVSLYHERWQAETTYYSIKATMLDGRVLRSRTLPGIDQEIWALLAACQALIRAAADTAATAPGLDMDRISFTILLQTAGNLITTATSILPAGPPDLAGAIGRAALAGLLPAWRRPRLKARTRKNPTTKYRHPTPHSPPHRPDLHLPRPDHLLRRRACAPRTALNASALVSTTLRSVLALHCASWSRQS